MLERLGETYQWNLHKLAPESVEQTQEDAPADSSEASPEAGCVEKIQEDTPAGPSQASMKAGKVGKDSRRQTCGVFRS